MAEHLTDGSSATHSDAQEGFTFMKIGTEMRAPTREQLDSMKILEDLYIARIGFLERLFETDEARAQRRRRNQLLYGTTEG